MEGKMEPMYKRNTMRHWYIGSENYYGKDYYLILGQFFNRPGFYEGMNGHSSEVMSVTINEEEEEYEIQTRNTLYHCSFDSLRFEQQDKSSYRLPDYERIKEKYWHPVDRSSLGKDDMLLVVSDYSDFYFESLLYWNKDGSEGGYAGDPHLGMVVDTFLIRGRYGPKASLCPPSPEEHIDIRYYVGGSGFRFYSLETGGRNLWIENRGDNPLWIFGGGKSIRLESGKRIKLMDWADMTEDKKLMGWDETDDDDEGEENAMKKEGTATGKEETEGENPHQDT
ncbi:MAG: hypothetical protein K6G18_01795 [Treponema sp.]|nr:hypothetical protein [Treponema sp.]